MKLFPPAPKNTGAVCKGDLATARHAQGPQTSCLSLKALCSGMVYLANFSSPRCGLQSDRQARSQVRRGHASHEQAGACARGTATARGKGARRAQGPAPEAPG